MSKVGLVLSGGGARGFFHIGVLMALQRLKVKVDMVAGCSIGAMIGTMYAKNPDINLEEVVIGIDFTEIVKAILLGRKPSDMPNLVMYIKKFVKANRFEELLIPSRFNATDLNNKKEIIFQDGMLFPGLIASMSLPGIFSPVKYKDTYLVDGGVINNIPTSLIANDVDSLIISDITAPVKEITDKSSPADIFMSSIAFLQKQNIEDKNRLPQNKPVIELNLTDTETSLLEFKQKNSQKLIILGYQSVMDRADQIKSL